MCIRDSAGPSAEEISFTPHKAIYDVRTTKVNQGEQLLNIEGEMVFIIESSCDGWISDHSFVLNYDYADTPRIKAKNHISTYESYDGTQFEFISNGYRNEKVTNSTKGYAEILDKKKTAYFITPKEQSIELPETAIFPMQHTYALLELSLIHI